MEHKQYADIINPLDPEKESLHNEQIERTVLATLMNSNQALVDTNDILTSECFYDRQNREIFEAIRSVYNNGQFPDMMLVSDELAKRGSSITAIQVTELCFSSTLAFDIQPHALILRDYSLRMRLWHTAYRILCQSTDKSIPLTAIHQYAKGDIDNLFNVVDSDMSTLETSYKRLQERMLINMNMQEGAIFGTRTGFEEIDNKGGLCGGDLIIIGAETSQGKTSFATALSVSAIENGDAVAFYSMEMTSTQLTARIASMRSGISSSRILSQRMTIEEILLIDRCMEGFNTCNMFFDEKSTSSLDSVVMSIRLMKMRHNINGAVVDYLQLVNTNEKGLNIEQATAKCARDLKNLAKELDIWIIAISQLSRNPQNPVPSMSRLRNSGQIEEAADIIALIYRPRELGAKYPEPFSDIPTENTALVMIEKGRNIGTGQFVCGFKPENTLFYPLSQLQIADLKRRQYLPGRSSASIDEEFPF